MIHNESQNKNKTKKTTNIDDNKGGRILISETVRKTNTIINIANR